MIDLQGEKRIKAMPLVYDSERAHCEQGRQSVPDHSDKVEECREDHN